MKLFWTLSGVSLLVLIGLAGCGGGGPVAPGGGGKPPDWVTTEGVVSVVPGDGEVTVHWGEAVDLEDPPVEYLIYIDTDSSPWDRTPVVRSNNDPFTFTGLTNGLTYWLGVRCRDSAKPPHVDDNIAVLSTVPSAPEEHGWARTWGGENLDLPYDVAVDASRNAYVAGTFSGTVDFDPGPGEAVHTPVSHRDAFLSKFDSSGDFLWVLTWGGIAQIDEARGVAVDKQGDIYVTGETDSETIDLDPGPGVDMHAGECAFLIKLDPSGNYLWGVNWIWDSMDVAVDDSDGVYFIGADDHLNVLLTKFDSSGTHRWTRTVVENEWYWPEPCIGVAVGGSQVYVAGRFQGLRDFDPGPDIETLAPVGDSDCYLSAFDLSGDYLWTRTWGGKHHDFVQSAAADNEGNVCVTGSFWGTVDFDPGPAVDDHTANGHNDMFVTKLDSSGSFLWARTWGGFTPVEESTNSSNGVAIDPSGNVLVVGRFLDTVDFDPGVGTNGHTTPPPNNPYANPGEIWHTSDCFLSKFTASGDFLWAQTWGGFYDDEAVRVAVDGSGCAYVTGKFQVEADFNPGDKVEMHHGFDADDAFLTKFPPSGNW